MSNLQLVTVSNPEIEFDKVDIERLEDDTSFWTVKADGPELPDELHLSVNGEWFKGNPHSGKNGYEPNPNFLFQTISQAIELVTKIVNK